MFGFIKKMFFTGLRILSSVNLIAVTPLRCISMINQECKVGSEVVNVNSNEPVFYPFSIITYKCSGTCNMNMNDIHKYIQCEWPICETVCSWCCKKLRC